MARIDTVTVIYEGEELEVDFYYIPRYAGTYFQPPEPEEAEIQAVRIDGFDYIDICTDEDFEKIEELVLEKHAKLLEEHEKDMAYEQWKDNQRDKELNNGM